MWRKLNRKRKRTPIENDIRRGKKKIMSIVFIPHTKKRNLATRMRSKLKAFENL